SQASAIRPRVADTTRRSEIGCSVPVIRLYEAGRRLLPLKRKLIFGKLCHCCRLPKKEAVYILQDPAHPLVQLDVGELIVEKCDGVLGERSLNVSYRLFLVSNVNLIISNSNLLGADRDVLLGQSFRKLPLLLSSLITCQRRKYCRSSRIFRCD